MALPPSPSSLPQRHLTIWPSHLTIWSSYLTIWPFQLTFFPILPPDGFSQKRPKRPEFPPRNISKASIELKQVDSIHETLLLPSALSDFGDLWSQFWTLAKFFKTILGKSKHVFHLVSSACGSLKNVQTASKLNKLPPLKNSNTSTVLSNKVRSLADSSSLINTRWLLAAPLIPVVRLNFSNITFQILLLSEKMEYV